MRTTNIYTAALGELRRREMGVGVAVHPDHRLSITPVRSEGVPERVTSWSSAGRPALYFRIVKNSDGTEGEEPIPVEEFRRACETIRPEVIDITDRARLVNVRARGHAEVAELEVLSGAFRRECDRFYRSRQVTEPFDRLHESFCT